MADAKVSAMPAEVSADVVQATDLIYAVIGGNSVKISIAELAKSLLKAQGAVTSLYSSGLGAPTFSAMDGSRYIRSDGGPNQREYVNTSGSGTSGTVWTPVPDIQFSTDYTHLTAAHASGVIDANAKRLFSVQVITLGTAAASITDGVSGAVMMPIPASTAVGTPLNINGGGLATNPLYWNGGTNTPEVMVYWGRQ